MMNSGEKPCSGKNEKTCFDRSQPSTLSIEQTRKVCDVWSGCLRSMTAYQGQPAYQVTSGACMMPQAILVRPSNLVQDDPPERQHPNLVFVAKNETVIMSGNPGVADMLRKQNIKHECCLP